MKKMVGRWVGSDFVTGTIKCGVLPPLPGFVEGGDESASLERVGDHRRCQDLLVHSPLSFTGGGSRSRVPAISGGRRGGRRGGGGLVR